MSFRDPEQRRAYNREYQRLQRGGVCQTPCQTLLPPDFRLKTAQDILELLAEQVLAVRQDPVAKTLEKARTIGFLAGVALRAVEASDMAERVESLERALRLRKD